MNPRHERACVRWLLRAVFFAVATLPVMVVHQLTASAVAEWTCAGLAVGAATCAVVGCIYAIMFVHS